MIDQLFGVIYKSTVLVPESSFYNKFVIGKCVCKSVKQFKNFNYVGSSKYIKNVAHKYGRDESKIKVEVIYQMFDNAIQTRKEKHKELGKWEIHFIKLYDSQNPEIGMNLTSGGGGIYDLSEESRKIMSLKAKNRLPKTQEQYEYWKKSFKGGNKGKKRTIEQNENNKKQQLKYYETHDGHNKGKKFNDEWRQKLKDSAKKRQYTKKCLKCEKDFICSTNFAKYCDEHRPKKHIYSGLTLSEAKINYYKNNKMPQDIIDKIKKTKKIKFIINKLPFELYTSLIGG
jgi:hypothetical protein